MENLQEKIEIAIEKGLFDNEKITEKNQIFDFYGNYCFPTDFSNSEENTILSVSQYNTLVSGQ